MKEYEPINFTYYDPSNSLFKGSGNDHSRYTVYFCNNKENCQAFARGKCVMLCGLWGESCPYGRKNCVNGPTKRARSLYSFLSSAKKQYEKVSYKLKDLKFTARIGDKVYISLPYLKNYVNPIAVIEGEHFINEDVFTVDFIIALADFRPRTLFGNDVIRSYQAEEVPKFITQIKKYFPELYQRVMTKHPDLEQMVENVNYVDKFAKVKTLLSGKVRLSTDCLEWDGSVLTAKGKSVSFWGLSDERVVVYPNDETYVKVADNDTVTDDTVFRDD
jgi:hypothetical protein